MTLNVDGICIDVQRKKIKNMHLYVSTEGAVRATVPQRLSDEQIEKFILSKLDWIKKHLERSAAQTRNTAEYLDGDTVYLFGIPYTLRILKTEGRAKAEIGDKSIILSLKETEDKEKRKALLDKLYKKELSFALAEHLAYWENVTKLKCTEFSIRDLKTRWGSCSVATGKMRFNLGLAQKSQECIEYVALHELAHLKVSNHGKKFCALLDKYMPDWRARRDLLNVKVKKA